MVSNNSKSLYGLIGHPVGHSLSPVIHNAAFKASGINAQYILLDIIPEELEGFLLDPDKEVKDQQGNVVRAGDIRGFNVTVPHKVRAKEILRNYSAKDPAQILTLDNQLIEMAGALNTVKREEGQLVCYNTDIWGFRKSLEIDLKFGCKDKNVMLMGCGGAGRAVVAGLALDEPGVNRIFIYEKRKETVKLAESNFSHFKHISGLIEFIDENDMKDVVIDCQLLVNATPVGMADGDVSPLCKDFLHKDLSVYDVVYNRETQLIKDARDRGLRAAGGRGMLAYQGARAWGLWFERDEPCDIMLKALEKELG